MFRVFVFCLLAAFSLGSEIEDRFEEWKELMAKKKKEKKN